MDYQISYEAHEQYLLVRISGPYDPVRGGTLMKSVRETALQGRFSRILLDVSTVPAPPSEIDRYQMGMVFADLFPPPFKIAVLFTAVRDKFLENTAVIRGADMFVCADEAEAVTWLLADMTDTETDTLRI